MLDLVPQRGPCALFFFLLDMELTVTINLCSLCAIDFLFIYGDVIFWDYTFVYINHTAFIILKREPFKWTVYLYVILSFRRRKERGSYIMELCVFIRLLYYSFIWFLVDLGKWPFTTGAFELA